MAIYVDDGLIAADNEEDITPVMEHLSMKFDIKILNLKLFLGMEPTRDKKGGIFLGQSIYAKKVLNKFNMEECGTVSTPIDVNKNAGSHGDSEVNQKFPYREAVGSLMFLAIATRPGIQYAVGVVSRYMEKPTNAHVNMVKRILKYLNGTIEYGIYFEAANKGFLSGFCDADYAADMETRRSNGDEAINIRCHFLIQWRTCELEVDEAEDGGALDDGVGENGSYSSFKGAYLVSKITE